VSSAQQYECDTKARTNSKFVRQPSSLSRFVAVLVLHCTVLFPSQVLAQVTPQYPVIFVHGTLDGMVTHLYQRGLGEAKSFIKVLASQQRPRCARVEVSVVTTQTWRPYHAIYRKTARYWLGYRQERLPGSLVDSDTGEIQRRQQKRAKVTEFFTNHQPSLVALGVWAPEVFQQAQL
jgi:hypothetical protein